MLLEPYNKANCIAMLNTLFPPVTDSAKMPTSQLTPHILQSQRDGFFRYICARDTSGRQVLDQVVMQGAREGDETGWPLVRDALDQYLRIANEVIDQCFAVRDRTTLEEELVFQSHGRKTRKADSGISFGSSETNPSVHSSISSIDITDKPLPPSPTREHTPRPGGSTLERLARELRKLGDGNKIKGLAKMRTNSALSFRSESHSDNLGAESHFDIDDRKRKRLVWEANNRKKTHAKQPSHDSR